MATENEKAPQYSQEVEDELSSVVQRANGPPMFIIKVDANGVGELLAAPGRTFNKIAPGTESPATALQTLNSASWQIYVQNPTRGRGCIGGDCYDGG